jgi:hypothetical protein
VVKEERINAKKKIEIKCFSLSDWESSRTIDDL